MRPPTIAKPAREKSPADVIPLNSSARARPDEWIFHAARPKMKEEAFVLRLRNIRLIDALDYA